MAHAGAVARARPAPGSTRDANNAVTETPSRLALAREAGDKTIVLLKNATTRARTAADRQAAADHVPATGASRCSCSATSPTPPNFYLGGYSSTQGAAGAGERGQRLHRHQERDPGDQPAAPRSTSCAASPAPARPPATLTAVDPAAVAAAANYDDVIVYTGTDARHRRPRTRTATAPRSRCPALQGSLISAGRGREPEHDRLHGDDRPDGRHVVRADHVRRSCGAPTTACARATRSPTCCSARTTRAAARPAIWYQSNVARSRRSPTTRSGPSAPTGPHVHVLQRAARRTRSATASSYTTFAFSNLQRRQATRRPPTTRSPSSVDVTNTSARRRQRDRRAVREHAERRPVARSGRSSGWRASRRCSLAAGQTKTVTFPLKIADLAFFSDADGKWEVDHGRVRHPDQHVERRRRHPAAGHDHRQRRAHAEAERR